MKALRSFTVPSEPAPRADRARDAGDEPALVVGRPRPATCSAGSIPTRGTPRSTTRCGCSASCAASGSSALAGDPGVHALPRRGRTPSCSATSTAPRGSRPASGTRAAVGRVLLARVRHRRGAPAVLRRPRRARRRPPEGGARPRRAARRRRPVLPPRLLPPGARRRRLAAGALPRRSTRTRWRCTAVRRRPGHASTSPATPLHAQVWRADVGRIPLTCSTPTSTRTRPTLRRVTDRLYGGDTEHRLPPGDPARHRRRARPATALGIEHPGVPHQRGPRRLPRARAHPPS